MGGIRDAARLFRAAESAAAAQSAATERPRRQEMNGKWASHSVDNALVRQWPTKDEESADLFRGRFDDFWTPCGIRRAV